MVTIQLGVYEASIDGGVWTSKNTDLAAMLQTMHPHGVSTAWPDRDLRQANEVIDQLGGHITFTSPPLEAVEGDDVLY